MWTTHEQYGHMNYTFPWQRSTEGDIRREPSRTYEMCKSDFVFLHSIEELCQIELLLHCDNGCANAQRLHQNGTKKLCHTAIWESKSWFQAGKSLGFCYCKLFHCIAIDLIPPDLNFMGNCTIALRSSKKERCHRKWVWPLFGFTKHTGKYGNRNAK